LDTHNVCNDYKYKHLFAESGIIGQV